MQNLFEQDADGLTVLEAIGVRLVPEQPTKAMCRAGCAAAGEMIDPATLRRIYNAMLIAAIDCPLCGDQVLN